mgnify:CR=1 FL=1|jgi:hypothetical protein
MAYILPNGVIQFMQYDGDKNYNHTVLFDSEAEQDEYFRKRVTATLDNQSYSRYTKKSVRVRGKSDALMRYNYLRFKNTAYNSKWFYAFIDEIEYVSNEVSEVFFTIDVIQTWMFNFDFGKCFIEREHTATDERGEHLIPENLEIGDYIVAHEELIKLNGQHIEGNRVVDGLSYHILATEVYHIREDGERVWTKVAGSIYGDLVLPYSRMVAPVEGDVLTIINNYNKDGKIDAIVGVLTTRNYDDNVYTHTEEFEYARAVGRFFEGYAVRNNKLYSYPYCMITVDNGLGQTCELKFELFNTDKIKFELINSVLDSSACMLIPTNYRNLPKDYDSGLPFDQYPNIPYQKEVFSTWIAQNKNQINASIQNSIMSTMVGTITGAAKGAVNMDYLTPISNYAGNVVSLANQSRSIMAKVKDLKAFPPQISSHSNQLPITLSHLVDRFGYSIKWVGIKWRFAKMIDDYFTMYGYQVNSLKTPNYVNPQTRRPRWNYVKTNGCVIHPKDNDGLPASVEETMSNIFDKGITFWSPSVTIGDYTGVNSPQEQT